MLLTLCPISASSALGKLLPPIASALAPLGSVSSVHGRADHASTCPLFRATGKLAGDPR